MYHYHRPSRAFWFLIGAASAALWIKHREHRYAEGRYGPCIRQRAIQPATQQQGVPAEPRQSNNAPLPPPSAVQTSEALHSVSRVINNIPPAEAWGFGERRQMEKWQEDKEKLMDFTLRATDAVRIYRCEKIFTLINLHR
jgi:hypothetical protein